MDMFLKYDWPGNYISEKELPLTISQEYSQENVIAEIHNNIYPDQSLEEIERKAILAALHACRGNKSRFIVEGTSSPLYRRAWGKGLTSRAVLKI